MSALAACVALCCGAAEPTPERSRGVVPLPEPWPPLPSRAGSGGAAGLFVGVRTFAASARIPDVPYAVDDAIDLAYLMTFPQDLRRRLLLPREVRLALSGRPQKAASQAHLDELLAAGAVLVGASRAEIERWLDQAGGVEGSLLWVSFATHGRSLGRDDYLLVADSRLDDLAGTAVAVGTVLERVGRRAANLRLVVLDACREPVSGVSSARRLPALEVSVDVQSKGPLAVLRARVGGPLFDDDRRRQGIFTGALLGALSCRASTDDWGNVTVSRLADHVNREVADWMRGHVGLAVDEVGVESHWSGTAGEQPLVRCHECPRPDQPDRLSTSGERLEVFAADGRLLWTRNTSGRIGQAEIADLDGDGGREVVVGVSTDGSDTGWVHTLDCRGNKVWSVDTTAPSPYARPAATSGKLAVLRLTVADLFGSGSKQVLSLSHDAQGWLPSRLCVIDEGEIVSSYWHPGHLWHLEVGAAGPDQPTRIVVAGKNNDLGAALPGSEYVDALFLFDPAEVRGHAPPYHDGLERGTQLWYAVVLPKEVDVQALDLTDRDHDGQREIAVSMNRGHFLYLDFDGCVVGSGRGDAAEGDLRYGLVEGDAERCRRPR